jgi:fumarate reductase flavoprotein subunit
MHDESGSGSSTLVSPQQGATDGIASATLSKRDFLKAAGAAAVGLAGAGDVAVAASNKDAAAPSARPVKGATYDLIVVGGGNAGLPAALFAAQRGAKVLLIDAAGALGGTLFLSSGQMSAAGTKLQQSMGIEDTWQLHYDDIMRISTGTADPVLVKLAVQNAAAAFDWLTDHGFKVRDGHPVTGTTHDPYSRPRYAWGYEGGRSILKVLMEQLQPLIDSGKVKVLLQTQVTGLIQERDGSVSGVVTQDEKGATARHLGRSTALTCGGYTENAALYEKYEGVKDYSKMTYPYSQGAGYELGLAAGGYVRGGENHVPLFGAVTTDYNYPAPMMTNARHFPGDRPPWEIYVNKYGKRFICEDMRSHTEYERGLGSQPDERCWAVFDDAIYHAMPRLLSRFPSSWTDQDTAEAFETAAPNFFRADTLEGLAKAAKIDPAGLVSTVEVFNAAQSGKRRDPFGREHMPMPIAKGPFYAIQLQSWNLTAYAGIAVDDQLRVVRKDGRPIPNLYAAGELLGMGQLMGKAVCGGMSVTPALALGRLLGNSLLPLATQA